MLIETSIQPPASIENIENLIPIDFGSYRGIYFLCHKGLVVYVGQSQNVYTRIDTHVKEGKKAFDSVFVRIVSKDLDLNVIEDHFIQKLRPYYNYQSKQLQRMTESTPEEIAEALIKMQERIELRRKA